MVPVGSARTPVPQKSHREEQRQLVQGAPSEQTSGTNMFPVDGKGPRHRPWKCLSAAKLFGLTRSGVDTDLCILRFAGESAGCNKKFPRVGNFGTPSQIISASAAYPNPLKTYFPLGLTASSTRVAG
jgi:hypothetical protein